MSQGERSNRISANQIYHAPVLAESAAPARTVQNRILKSRERQSRSRQAQKEQRFTNEQQILKNASQIAKLDMANQEEKEELIKVVPDNNRTVEYDTGSVDAKNESQVPQELDLSKVE